MNELNENNDEQNDVIQNASKHYALGILGALLGAFIATIPWILMYVYGNMILSALAIIIAIGALKGYQIFKGTIDKKLPFIISIFSLLAVIVATLLIIPMLMIIKDGYAPTIANFELLYSSSDFTAAIIHDLIISIAFTVLGISGVVANVNKQIKDSDKPLKEIKISSTLSNTDTAVNNEEVVHSVKDIFVKYNATSKENAIDKDTIFTELQELENGKQLFNTLKTQQIIRKTKGKYYFSEKNEQSVGRRFAIIFGKIMLFIILVIVVVVALILIDPDNSTTNNSQNTISNSDTARQTTYSLADFNMEIRVPINMVLGSDADITDFFGEEATDFYECVLYNENDLISCFTQKCDSKAVDSYYTSLKKSFTDSDYTILSDFQKEIISGFEFTTFETQKKGTNGIMYNDFCLGYFSDGKFVFFEYTYPSENSKPAKEVMENVIKKLK